MPRPLCEYCHEPLPPGKWRFCSQAHYHLNLARQNQQANVDFKIESSLPPKRAKYPWAKWCDGQTHLIVRGVDYQCMSESIYGTLWNHAHRHGYALEIAVQKDNRGIWVGWYFRFEKKRTSSGAHP